MLFVTFHGGHPGKHPHRNNVHAYDKEGRLITPAVLEQPGGVLLDELRGIYRVGKLLYVAVANRTQNSLLCYRGSGTQYRFVGRFASREICRAIVHPFDFTFDARGFCYLSSQDTNLVTRLRVSADGETGTPAAIAPALRARGDFAPGTFVASSVGRLCRLPTTAVPSPIGLEYSGTGLKKHSVRGVVWVNRALYVVDEPASRVKLYSGAGKFLGESNEIDQPVHLAVHHGSLFVSGGNRVFTAKLSNPPGNFRLAAIAGLRVKNGGGMAFSKKGRLYIASRTERKILKFDSDFRPLPFGCHNLPDDPEFLLHL